MAEKQNFFEDEQAKADAEAKAAAEKVAAEEQAKKDAEKDSVEVVDEPVKTVQLSADFADANDVDSVWVSVASFEDIELRRGESYDVPMVQGQLLVESPAVEDVE